MILGSGGYIERERNFTPALDFIKAGEIHLDGVAFPRGDLNSSFSIDQVNIQYRLTSDFDCSLLNTDAALF